MTKIPPLKTVIITWSIEHVSRHDFWKDNCGFGYSIVNDFIRPFEQLANFPSLYKAPIVEIFEYRDLPKKYQALPITKHNEII